MKECYLMDGFNINLLSGKKCHWINKIMSPTARFHSQKKIMDLCFSHPLHQFIAELTRTTERTIKLIEFLLANFPEKMIQSSIIGMGLSDHELNCCSRKTSIFELNEHCKILIRSIKNCSGEIFWKN